MGKKRELTKKEVHCIVKKFNIRIAGSYSIKNGLVNIDGDFHVTHTSIRKLPLRFGRVTGDFICSSNRLQTLSGAPRFVGGNFNCYGNELKSLKYAPSEVGGDFSSHENVLTSLSGSPKSINGNFNVFLNQLENLNGGPEKVAGSYYAFKNRLITLEGSPLYVGGSLHVAGNRLNNLKRCPEFIGDIFAFDNDVRMDLGNENCIVKTVVIQVQEKNVAVPEKCLPDVVITNQQYLATVFSYTKYISLYNSDGSFNEDDFTDFITEIKGGLR